MAHAKPNDLADIEVLIENIRKITLLKEKSAGCFYLKSKGVLHFHIKNERRYAHVFNGKNWEELDIKPSPSPAEQKRLLRVIGEILPLKK